MSATIATTLIEREPELRLAEHAGRDRVEKEQHAANTRHHTQTGIVGEPPLHEDAGAVNSEPSATTQHSQYSHAVVKPVAGLMDRAA